ncbi:DUF2332 domain-containing protein [Nocardioides panaciterrulae]|uniref:DUF2332 domain-containing protein n=1 Tax=Nocardioides panaciterrulae TaxID=661492 RepID=A0A7Y9E327_9ACTN|nr:hypothetical protein [Nocardioides panaciterrulae]
MLPSDSAPNPQLGQEIVQQIARDYSDFAAQATDSPCFVAWARGVAGDPDVLAWLAALPDAKRQPNLVFAAARRHGVAAPGPYAGLRAALLADDGRLRETVLTRSTQTNEVGRLATLAPAFALLGEERPLALVEVGASAGLCLYPDRYRYEWQTPAGTVRAGAGPLLPCEVTGPAPLPADPPAVAWRGGVDLNPLDVADPDAMDWLTTLVWPEHTDRRDRLHAAIDVARTDPPRLVAGDLLEELPALVDEAAAHGPVVVFHSAVLAYLDEARRARFAETMEGLVAEGRCHWVSNEGKRVLPAITATGSAVPEELPTFVLGVDGRAVAWTHGHGRSMTWLG